MDIVIKSYNRAYLLDRVLYSVKKYVLNGIGKIIVLDDGTPQIFLDRIKEKYPEVIIKYSPNYQAKLAGEKFGAPVQFWREEIKLVSDYFLLLEDDIWLTEPLDLILLETELAKRDVSFCKLRWWGNPKMINGTYEPFDCDFGLQSATLPFASEWFVKNRFFLHSLLIKLKAMPPNYFTPMYTLYDVAGHIFSKEFYLYVWPEEQDRIEEMIQLGKAAEWFRKKKEKRLARSKDEVLATTFISSSSGNKDKLGFDMDILNDKLNQEWLMGRLDELQNFPNDFSLSYIVGGIVSNVWDTKSIESWKKWSIDWRIHFGTMGSDLSLYNNTNELV